MDVNTNSGNITAITETRPFTSASNFSSASANVTGAPLNGRAYNGIAFNLTNPDQFVLARQNATRLQLPASVYQAALQTPQGAVGNFGNISYSTLVDQVYVGQILSFLLSNALIRRPNRVSTLRL